MRLDELHLAAFGRFHGRTMALAPGLNVIYGPNEAGKSTLWHFIVAMLYGFARPDLKTRRLLPEYERYRPWPSAGGGGYRGVLLLTQDNGRRLRLERDFARHQVWVNDDVSGVPLDLQAGTRAEVAPGQALLGLSRGEFTATVAVGQLQVGSLDPGAAAALAARMAALQATGREDENAARADARLAAWLKQAVGSPRARQSPLGEALAELKQVEDRIVAARRVHAELREWEARERQLTAELAALQAAEAELQAVPGPHRPVPVRDGSGSAGDPAAEDEPLAALDPDEAARVPAYFEAYQQAREAAAAAVALLQRQRADDDRPTAAAPPTRRGRTRQAAPGATGMAAAVAAAVAALLAAGAGLALGALADPRFYLLLGAAVPLLWWAWAARQRLARRAAALQAERAAAAPASTDLESYRRAAANLEAARDRLLDRLRVAAPCSPLLARAVASGRVGQDEIAAFTRLWQEYCARREARQAAQQARRTEVAAQIRALTARHGELLGMLRQAQAELPDLAALERRRDALQQRVADLELQRRALETARTALATVAERLHRDFAPRLAAQVAPILAAVTGGRYTSVRISDQLDLAAEGPGRGPLRPVQDYSAGTVDQFYFALRLGAALTLTANGERPPLLCDDTLVQYDDDRAAACLRYLQRLGESHQVLLLTCHGRERDLGRELGAHLVTL